MITFCTIQNVEKDCQTNIEPITVIMMKKIASGIFLKYSSNELLFIAKMTFLYLQISFYLFIFFLLLQLQIYNFISMQVLI